MRTALSADFPNDSDGEALRRVASDGSEMSKPMDIDFAVAVPDEPWGAATRRSPRSTTKNDAWTVYCTKRMLPTYERVVAAQGELDALSNPFGGFSDGWGTFGNDDAS